MSRSLDISPVTGQRRLRRWSFALIVFALIAVVLLVGTRARAASLAIKLTLPDGTTQTFDTARLNSLPQVNEKTYSVRRTVSKNKKKTEKWTVSGVTFTEILRSIFPGDEAKIAEVPYIAVEWPRTKTDQGGLTILSRGDIAGTGLDGPALLVTGGTNDTLKQSVGSPRVLRSMRHPADPNGNDSPLLGGADQFAAVVGKGKSLAVKITAIDKGATKKGVIYEFKADVKDAPEGTVYTWRFGDLAVKKTGKTVRHEFVNCQCRVWVRAEAPDGSVGAAAAPINGKRPPAEPTSTGGSTTPPPSSGPQVAPAPPPSSSPAPAAPVTPAPPATSAPPPKPDTPKPSEPTDSTTSDQSATPDPSQLASYAQNTPDNGIYRQVSGVLLSQPIPGAAPPPDLGGIAGPVGEVASELFKHADPRVTWPFLFTILFATCLAGIIREAKRP